MTDTTPTLTLYNSLTRKKEVFTPQNPKRVTMYNCGPTVYSYAHIGNARAAVVADVLFRVLRHIYPERPDWKEGEEPRVVYARNITDVDDKIIASAKEQGVDISEVTEKYARIYNEDLAAIGCLPPTVQPKCTAHIDGMVDMISDLITKGFAYESDRHVFFDVSKYDDYGKLSGNTLENLRGGDRVGEGEVARKKNAADFVLWKPELDGVGWDAPFGKGRPGWHIECSAMAKETLTEPTKGTKYETDTIDIHCGGVDLKFPHHENEIAQSECAHDGAPMANYWVHNEFLTLGKMGDSVKMSKSKGNVFYVNDLLKAWDGEVIRLALLKAHYRSELVWTEDLLTESKSHLDGWYRIKLNLRADGLVDKFDPLFENLISNDLSLPTALSRIALLLRKPDEPFSLEEVNEIDMGAIEPRYKNDKPTETSLITVFNSANLLGLLLKDPEDWFRGGASDDEGARIDALVADYDAARAGAMAAKAAGDKAAMGAAFGKSDELRDQFKTEGIIVETNADGKSTWRKG